MDRKRQAFKIMREMLTDELITRMMQLIDDCKTCESRTLGPKALEPVHESMMMGSDKISMLLDTCIMHYDAILLKKLNEMLENIAKKLHNFFVYWYFFDQLLRNCFPIVLVSVDDPYIE
jgi:hypothetical protein